MRRFGVLAALLLSAALAAAQNQNLPDPTQAFGVVASATISYVLAALVSVAVLFALVLGIRFFMGVARRAVGR
jgi:hypothetical protein